MKFFIFVLMCFICFPVVTKASDIKPFEELLHNIEKFRDNGFETTLISGETNLNPINGVKFISVKSAEEMFKETLNNLPVDVAVFSAAVADYKIKNYNDDEIIIEMQEDDTQVMSAPVSPIVNWDI